MTHFLRRTAAPVALATLLAIVPAAASAVDDFSAAEQALFLDNHLATARPPLVIHYSYHKSGSLDAAFDDGVDLDLTAQPDGSCCVATTRFLSGPRTAPHPEINGVKGNPAILYFLERDIHEMQRLTKGQPNYFRSRIRLAIYKSAAIRELKLPYRGQKVSVREITIAPYQDDPMRARFERFTGKRYVFMLSPEVPGGLYAIHTRIPGPNPEAQPLIDEQMILDGAGPLPLDP